ncbi:hypothetical protein HY407_01045 [Candidatus Gottesmanbacteria bacterium]|nr:hypothetical protein [Candidatus Gottesmanbacteria bacterium]
MITIIHGDDEVTSRNKLKDLKEKSKEKETITLDGKNITIADLKQALESQSLFLLEKLVIIENLLTRRPSKERDEAIKYISANKFDSDIIHYEEKEVTPAVLKKFPSAQNFNFKPQGNIFKFVDNIRPSSSKFLVPLFHELIKTEPPEVVFVMIVRQIRNILLASDSTSDYLKEFAPWQKAKISSQAKYFRQDYLVTIYRKLLEIDYKIKSGRTPLNLTQLLDIFLVNL